MVKQNLSHVSFSEANGNVSLQALRADWGIFPISWSGKEPYCSVFLFQRQSLSEAPAALVGDAVDVVSPQGGEGQGHRSLAPRALQFQPTRGPFQFSFESRLGSLHTGKHTFSALSFSAAL